MTKEDLQKKIQDLEDQLDSATQSLNEYLIAEYPLKVGTVILRRGDTYTVSSVKITYGSPKAWGRKTLKDGSLGRQEFELYGNFEVEP